MSDRPERELQAEVTKYGVRSVINAVNIDTLTPRRVKAMLIEAESGDLSAQAALFEKMEEKDGELDAHLRTRKAGVTQADWEIEAADESREAQRAAELCREIIGEIEGVQDAAFDLLDAIPKGFAVQEIEWKTGRSEWRPVALHYRPQRWFRIGDDGSVTFVRNRMGLRVYLRERLPEAIPDNRYFFVSIVGLINALDHHSSFLSPDLFKELQVETKGSFAGLGIEITIRDGVLTIVSPLEGTPAFKVGLMAGDQIVEIEEESTAGISLIEAVKLLRGPRGTEVTITILREGMADPKKVTIVRDIINIESVRSRLLDDGCLYVRVIQFSEKTTKDLKKAVDRIGGTAKGGIKGIILDLRNNPGGLLDQAVGVSDLFLESGKIVYTESRLSSQRMEFWADSDRDDSGQPLVVLINGGSSSASEIVAGALKDHNRAIVVGSQTFGKASVQTILPLEDGSALRLTTAKYYTVSGREIEAKGIDPHIVIEEAIQEAGGKEAGEKEEEAEEPPDLQLEKAQEILKDWEVYRRKHLGT